MKKQLLSLCIPAKTVSLLCSVLLICSPFLQAQLSFASKKRQAKRVAVATEEQTIQVSLKKVLDAAYDRYKLKFILDETIMSSLQVPAAWQELPADKLIRELHAFLKKHQLQLVKLSDQQFVIIEEGVQNLQSTKETKINKAAVALTIMGIVKDKAGTLLAGANITEKGTGNITATNDDGIFKINVQSANAVLVVSVVNYKTRELKVQPGVQMVIDLEQKSEDLSEVAVVAYGKQKKISVVGAQSVVQAEDLKMPVRSLNNTLAGQLAGIVAMQRSGEPGYDDAQIWIRGIATFGNSSPLVLVDGVPRSLSNIDPEDIASFTILKDASATAVYGVRGANGVILIETKKGKVLGKPSILVDLNQGMVTTARLPAFANAAVYARMVNEALITRDQAPKYSNTEIQKFADGSDPYLYPNVDWINEIMNKWGNNRKVNLNITGGSQNANYYVSASYYGEKGLFKTDELARYNSRIGVDRYNFTSNLTLKATPTTVLDLGVSGYIMNGNFPGNGTATIFNTAFILPPAANPVKYPDGKIAGQLSGELSSPYDKLTQSGYVTEWRNETRSNIKVKQQLDFWVKGLSMQGLFSFDAYNYHRIARTKAGDTWLATGRDSTGALQFIQTKIGNRYLGYERNNGGDRKFYAEASINYANNFRKHWVTAMVLYNQSDYVNGFAGDFIGSIPFRTRGVAARATYSFNDKYLAEVNFGYNGSENFSKENRYGFFPSMGVGYVLSNEKFFDPFSNIIQFFKIRATHGQVGNADFGERGSSGVRRFAYIGTVSTPGGYTFGQNLNNGFGGNEQGEYAVNVTWETSTKTDIGIEFRTLNNRLYIQADWFQEKRKGIFLRRAALPDYLGIINAPYGNLGVTENKGIDGSIEYTHNAGPVKLRFRGNFTFNRNKVIEDDLPAWTYPWLERKGLKIRQRFGYIAEGLFTDSAEIIKSPRQTGNVRPGDIRFRDMNGDGVIDSYDQSPIGYGPVPEIVYGFGFSLAYKGIDLSTFFQGVGNVDILLNGEGLVPFQQGGNRGNLLSNIEDHWTPQTPAGSRPFYPRLTFGNLNDNYATSSWWVTSGRFLRLKTAELGYTLPGRWLKPIGVNHARIYLLGYNLLTFAPFKLYDVELGDGKGSTYPNLTTYSAGVNIKF